MLQEKNNQVCCSKSLFQLTLFFLLASPAINSHASFLSKIWGVRSETAVFFLPFGYHFDSNATHYPDKNYQYLIGATIKGFSLGTFRNSYGDRVYFAALSRKVYKSRILDFGYHLGIMQGYKDHLSKYIGNVLGHDPGPLFALDIQPHITRNLAVEVVFYGLGTVAGINYSFP